jgi:hypothetical protein
MHNLPGLRVVCSAESIGATGLDRNRRIAALVVTLGFPLVSVLLLALVLTADSR